MSLLSVLSNARSSLSITSQQTAVVSRNVANAQDPSATRKYANSIYTRPGAVEIRSISQSSDPALYRTLINAQSSLGTNETIADALDRLREVIGDVDSPTSPSSSLAALKDALTDLAASPESAQLQRAAVDKAKAMTASLNTASDAVQAMRKDADTELKQSADAMRKLLSDLESVNNGVVVGNRSGNDVTDLKGHETERVRSWDSCFTTDFTYTSGTVHRLSARSRYRHWMTHKLSTWHDQFDESGCVGCGRCITWCPVGIDITEEAAAIRDE